MHPHFEFLHGHGLGVLAVGVGYSNRMDVLFRAEAATTHHSRSLRVPGRRNHPRSATWPSSTAEVERQKSALVARTAEVERQKSALVARTAEVERQKSALVARTAEVERQKSALVARTAEAKRQKSALVARTAEVEEFRQRFRTP